MKLAVGDKVVARYLVPETITDGEIIYVLGPHNGEVGTVEGCLGRIYRVRFANRTYAFLRADDLEKLSDSFSSAKVA